jgi:hypothetical protein
LEEAQVSWIPCGTGTPTLGACEITGATATTLEPAPAAANENMVPRTAAPESSADE